MHLPARPLRQRLALGAGRASATIGLAVLLLFLGCSTSDPQEPRTDLPSFTAPPLTVGALLCANGHLSAKTFTVEPALLLAEDHINGSTRAYPGVPPTEIPCRKSQSCGVWLGRDDAGGALRGPLRIVTADTEQRVTRAVAAARRLKDDFDAVAIVGPCLSAEMLAVQAEVTRTELALVTPVVTADSITKIDDRSPSDKANGLPGYVYRTIAPDYVQARLLAQFATNSSNMFLRAEDRTEDECTTAPSDHCESRHGQSHQCLRALDSNPPAREFYETTTEACSGQPENHCDRLGLNYACVEDTEGKGVCQRFRDRRYCTRVIQPKTALILYSNDSFGLSLKAEVEEYWTIQKQNVLLGARAFEPSDLASLPLVVADLFNGAAAQLGMVTAAGRLPAGYALEDSVVFLFAQAAEAALIFQEWLIQQASLPPGSDRVFWASTDELRSRILTDQVSLHTLRNLYITNPYDLHPDQERLFQSLYTGRWGSPPAEFAGGAFDAAILVALANERAGARRSATETGALTRNTPVDIKNSLEAVASGCIRRSIGELCSNAEGYTAEGIPSAKAALARGQEVFLRGVTGSLSFSPAGDRLNPIHIWKVAFQGSKPGFFQLSRITPEDNGVVLRE